MPKAVPGVGGDAANAGVAVPVSPPTGVTVTVRFEPLPPNTMLFVGTNAGFDEALLNVKLPTGVSLSLMVKASAAVGVLVKVVWSAISVMVGDCGPVVDTVKLQPPSIFPAYGDASS